MAYFCINPFCGRRVGVSRAGTFCSRTCRRDERLVPFREAKNDTCLDCDRPAMGGGVWCFDHFASPARNDRMRVIRRRVREAAA